MLYTVNFTSEGEVVDTKNYHDEDGAIWAGCNWVADEQHDRGYFITARIDNRF